MLKLPQKVIIEGCTYKIIEQNDLADSIEASGQSWGAKQLILIDKRMHQEQKESTLIHEVMEVLNQNHELNLPHNTICTLEAGIYSFLKTNKLLK